MAVELVLQNVNYAQTITEDSHAINMITSPREVVLETPLYQINMSGTPGSPGATGPQGGLTPENEQLIIQEATDDVLVAIQPPVSLILLFENGLV